jgi:hypothetical protein
MIDPKNKFSFMLHVDDARIIPEYSITRMCVCVREGAKLLVMGKFKWIKLIAICSNTTMHII